ncbi:hypothetical protein [Halorarius litoreus]|uniref:hypothetical protein n=1 Tax=Halorarius litoreus TaxID=2962676 RepID=UPI0020CD11F4|nr:hypothetical protein [Halorarius litoreus]
MATADSLVDRVFPLFDHTHDTVTTGVVVVSAAILGFYTSWMTADFRLRTPAFVVAALALGYLLYAQDSRRGVVAGALYSLAALVVLTPLLYELTILLRAANPLQHVLSVTDLVFVLLFWVVAAVPALVAYRLTTGPLLARLRSRD